MIRSTLLALSALALVAGPAGAHEPPRAAKHAAASAAAPSSRGDIVDVAVGAGSFKTLAAALQAAGLVDALKADGPFTVFAPTDAAFAALPPGTVDTLLKPENKAELVKVLTYHVVPGRIAAKDLAGKVTHAKTLQGQSVSVDGRQGVSVDNARVITADVGADNGVIHVIDRVLLPKR
ncbi:MAG: fasciclin domain-containing protein [Alphaproteobacteria bacterium]|nr:fasciclin domain-containing protein [Alphaproteobacteria bacterium]